MNVLILSVGTRNKIVQYFKSAFSGHGVVVATDASPLAPALYEADRHYLVPKIDSPEYLDVLLDICDKESITGVLSLIDPELSMISKHQQILSEHGVQIIGSSFLVNENCLDKFAMFSWMTSHGYPCATTYNNKVDFFNAIEKGTIAFPVFVKPAKGSASIKISKAHDKQSVDFLFDQSENMIIQQFLDGQEIGADCYIDLVSGELVSVFTKKKLVMRAGETDKAVSFKDEVLFELIGRFVKDFGFRGPIDIDLFEVDGHYYVSEVNPRFGGGYPLAYECGCNHMEMILKNLMGKSNANTVGEYEENYYLMKYNEVMVMSANHLTSSYGYL